MRDLTKSMGSFAWAMSLFGVQQMVNVMRPQTAAKAFDQVTDTTQEHLGELFKSTYKMGDQIQRSMVDLTFSFMTLNALNPDQWTKMATEMVDRATQAAGSATQGSRSGGGAPAPAGVAPAEEGWGPVPPRGA